MQPVNGHDSEQQPRESLADPHRLARLYIDARCRHAGDGRRNLIFWQGSWLRWNTSYRVVAACEIRAELVRSVKSEFDRLHREERAEWLANGQANAAGDPAPPPVARKVTRILIGDVEQALTDLALLDGRATPPKWLIKHPPFPAIEAVPFKNCVLHVSAQGNVNAAPVAVQPTPGFFCLHSLGYDFNPTAPEPVEWLQFLGTLWPNDQASIHTLQEFMGHLLTPDTSYQKILMLVGPRRSGKGTIARVIRAMLGPENVANPTLASLGTQFGLSPLLGKLAAIVTDARLSGRMDLAVVVENLLSNSGEDARTIDRKFMQPITMNLYARFMLITNELPKLTDASGALASRMLVLKLVHSFLGQEDRGLTGKLLAELPGILNWSLAGWRRLGERGHFVQPTSARAEVDLIADLSSPISAFIRERCTVGAEHSVAVQVLYRAWQLWCADVGKLGVGDEHRFGRDLRSVIPQIKVSQPRLPDGSRPRVYSGVGLLPVVGPVVVPARA